MAKSRQQSLKVLFIGNLDATSTSIYYATCLNRMGHYVYAYDPRCFATTNLFQKLAIKINKMPANSVLKRINGELIQICRQNRFDLVFVMGNNFVSSEAIETIKQQHTDVPRFVYHSHDNNFAAGIITPPDFYDSIPLYDYVFTTKSQSVERYRNLGQQESHFLPAAFEPSVHHPIPAQESRLSSSFSVSFVGTYDRSRDKYIEAIDPKRVSIWGTHWQKSPLYAANQSRIHPEAIYGFYYSDVISHSQIVLGLLREEADDLHTQRTFEIPACGALQVTPRNEEIATFFKEDKEIVCFGSLDELRDKVDYYLKYPNKAEAIAKRGYQRVTGEGNAYSDRTQTILDKAFAQSLKKKMAAAR